MSEIDVRLLGSNPYKYITKGNTRFIPVGSPTIGKLTNDFPTGRTTVVTGFPKDGKSTWLHQMALNAVDKGYKVLLIDGEHGQENLISDLYTKVIGKTPNAYIRVDFNKRVVYEPKPTVLNMLKDWHKDNLIVFSKYLSSVSFDNLDELFSLTKSLIESYKIDLVIWDNLMTLVEGTSSEKFDNQGRFMKRATALLKATNTHGVLVAHPNKNLRPGDDMTLYDVLGSSDIVNLTDYLIQVKKNHSKSCDDDPDGWIRLILNRPYGDTQDVPVRFDKENRCLYEINSFGRAIKYEFNWRGKHEQTKLAEKGFVKQL